MTQVLLILLALLMYAGLVLFVEPVLSILLFLAFVVPIYFLTRKMQTGCWLARIGLGFIALVLLILVPPLIHGRTAKYAIHYEVPVVVTVSPPWGAMGATSGTWRDDRNSYGGTFFFTNISRLTGKSSMRHPQEVAALPPEERNRIRQEIEEEIAKRAAEEHFRAANSLSAKVGYENKFAGYLKFHLSLWPEHVRFSTSNGEYLAVPIRKGEREFLVKDKKGKKWKAKTKTLHSQAKFERRYRPITLW
jgi:hypothetical protein